MADLKSLRHAYGSAADLPPLLARMVPEPDAGVWEELWSRLCHQGTTYAASFASLATLEATARRWPPEKRAAPLGLAAGIVASTVVDGSRDEFMAGLGSTVKRLEQLTEESLEYSGWSREDLIYLLQAAFAFRGDPLWGHELDRLLDGEFQGQCPACGGELYCVIGEYGFFAAADEWVNRPDTRRVPIAACTGELPPPGRWVRDRLLAADDSEAAEWIRYLFGTSRCPRCQHDFAIPAVLS